MQTRQKRDISELNAGTVKQDVCKALQLENPVSILCGHLEVHHRRIRNRPLGGEGPPGLFGVLPPLVDTVGVSRGIDDQAPSSDNCVATPAERASTSEPDEATERTRSWKANRHRRAGALATLDRIQTLRVGTGFEVRTADGQTPYSC